MVKGRVAALAFAAVLLCFLPFSATAADPPEGDLSSLTLEELLEVPVYGAAKRTQAASEAPALVTVVTAERIRDGGYRTLAEILADVRGLYVTDDWRYAFFGVRGFSLPGDYNSRVLLLLDGHRLNDAVYDQAPIGSDFPLDVGLIDRVEIVRGPGSALYGNNALLAVINVISRKGEGTFGTEVSGDVGSHRTARGRLSQGRPLPGGGELLLSGSLSGTADGETLYLPGFDDPSTNGGRTAGTNGERGKAAYGRAARGDFSLQGAWAERRKEDPTAAYGTVFNDPRNALRDRRGFVSLRYDGEPLAGKRLSGELSFDSYRYEQDYVYAGTDPATVVTHDQARGERFTGSAQASLAPFRGHLLTGGAEALLDTRLDQAYYRLSPFASLLDDRRRSSTLGAFLQDEVALREGLALTLGLRVDRYRSFGSTVSPRAALVWKGAPGGGVGKVLFGTAHRAPNAYELYYGDAPPGSPDATMKANPRGLDPEKVQTYEVTWEQPLGRRWLATAGAFRNDFRRLIAQVEDVDGLFVFRNVGKARTQGVELQAEGHGAAGERVCAAATLQDGTDRTGGTRLVNSPRILAWLSASSPLLGGRGEASARWRYAGERRTVSGGTVGGGGTVDATLRSLTLPWKGLSLSATVRNLFDRRLDAPASADVDPADRLPQAGRDFRLQGEYRF